MTMQPTQPDSPPVQRRRPSQSVPVQQIHDNISQEVITITADKLELALLNHMDCLVKKDAWHMPLSLVVGVIVVFCSSTFKHAFGISPDTWAAMFILFGLACFLWLVRALVNGRRAVSVKSLIEVIKNKQ
ncbi:hypothetical protein [Pseudomonas alvandae]|uniref:Phage holin family protein n=1 Tax=Pseudomonas canavaninivorans TaxID=2842348 RepID=A0ABX8QLZ5_PSECO|nr:hypothetical protein [Pseudomonas alvandae]QXI55782.1 hypothetical protein KSS97_12875 [Pseudomonas alvandae]